MKKIDIINELEKQKMLYEVEKLENKTVFTGNSDYKFSLHIKDNYKFSLYLKNNFKSIRSLFNVDVIEFYNNYIRFNFQYYEQKLNIKVYYNQIRKIEISKIIVLNSKEIKENIK